MKWNDLFKVETLDTRLASKTGEALPYAQPSRWNTPEYYIYYACFLTIPVFMFKSVYDVSKPEHPNYKNFEHLLEPGWIPGRMVDNSDAQYRTFRDNVPYMAALLVLHPLLRRAYDHFGSAQTPGRASGNKSREKSATLLDADARLNRRTKFDLFFAIVFLLALNGISTFKVLLILYTNYQIATALPRNAVAVTTWVFNVGILFANEICQGYRFKDVARVANTFFGQDFDPGDNWGAWLDSHGGLNSRWEVLFNITVLRLIAFNFDYLWNLNRGTSSPIEKKNLDPASLSERERVDIGAKPSDFTMINYFAYVLYSPLYLAGPIINFNDYISQCRHPLPTIHRDRIIPYALRFGLCLLTMEVVLHFMYAVAISSSHPDWKTYTPFQVSMLGFFNLHIIWLKLLLPWRFFRLWSLMDGIDPPENMVRCMSDNFSALAFWRAWHRSYNRWIIRYIYIPMGGSQGGNRVRAALNYLAVFTFVAMWHDINLRLLIWGWLIVLFVLPEVIARMLFPPKKWKDHPNQYRWLAGGGAVANILMMMAANLVGFAVGLDGLKGLVDGIVGTFGGRVFFLAACVTLFVGAQVMFEWRESERRRGIDLKC